MIQRLSIVVLGVAGIALSASALTPDKDRGVAAGNPYSPVVSRNIFGLVPIPVADPASLTPSTPPPKITPNGIMTIFGKVQVLFKVAQPAAGGQPAKELSYTLCEGDRQDEIEVKKIDEAAATITFDNHGIVQTLELAKAAPGAAGGAPPAAGGPGVPGGIRPGGIAAPTGHAGGASVTTVGAGVSRLAQARAAARNATSQGAASGGAGAAVSGGGAGSSHTESEPISPEAQIIMMEAQRAKFMDDGDSAATIIPPTPITDQVINNDSGQ